MTRIDRAKISASNLRDIENLSYVSCVNFDMVGFVMDLIETGSNLMADIQKASRNQDDLGLQKFTALKCCVETYDFLLKNEKLMEQMKDIFAHFENIPLVEEDSEP